MGRLNDMTRSSRVASARASAAEGEYHPGRVYRQRRSERDADDVARLLRRRLPARPLARIGGMNHFLFPGPEARVREQRRRTYGVHLMELLVNGLLQRGARRDRLEAKLFGGARTMDGLADIGARNAGFAERFLRNEGIRIVGGSLSGENGRSMQYWPVSGRARQAIISADKNLPLPVAPVMPKAADGEVEFF